MKTLLAACLAGTLATSVGLVAAPIALEATNVGENSFVANWQTSPGAVFHELDVAVDASFEFLVDGYESIAVGNASTWTIDGLGSGMTYYYRVRATYLDLSSDLSNSEMAQTVRTIGKLKWSYQDEPGITGGVAYNPIEERLFFGGGGGFYCINSTNGTQIWNNPAYRVRTIPVLGKNGSVFGLAGTKIIAFEASTGTVQWVTNLSNSVDTEQNYDLFMALGPGGHVVVRSGNNRITSYDEDSGNIQWEYNDVPRINRQAPSISEDQRVYFLGSNMGGPTFLIALELESGNELWRTEFMGFQNFGSGTIIGENGEVYCLENTLGPPGRLFCLDGFRGKLLWSEAVHRGSFAQPVIDNQYHMIVSSSENARLVSFDLNLRSENWAVPMLSYSESAIGEDGVIYVLSSPFPDGSLYAIDPIDGSTMWSFNATGFITRPPVIGQDGSIFFTTQNGTLYAVNSSSMGLQDSHWPKAARNNSNTCNGPNHFIHPDKTDLVFDHTEQQASIEIESNTDWSFEESVPWIEVTSGIGSGNAVVSVLVETNDTGAVREGEVVVGYHHIKVYQSYLPRPIALTPQIVSSNAFLAEWESIDGTTDYFLDVSTSMNFESFLEGYEGRIVGNSTTWFVSGLEPETVYYYRIRAFDGQDLGAFSDVVSITTSTVGVSGLEIYNIELIEESFVRIEFASSPGSLYGVLFSETPVGPWESISNSIPAESGVTKVDLERPETETGFYRIVRP